MSTTTIKLRRDSSADWKSNNPTLASGEVGVVTDRNTVKVGDGVTAWNSLDFLLPPGLILPYGGSTAPSGWLLCDGTAVSRTEYSELFASIGEAFGSGDGSTTFNLPDLRGMFLRGAGTYGGAKKKANGDDYIGPAVGAVEEDQGQGHFHETYDDVAAGAGYVGPGSSSTTARYAGASRSRLVAKEAITDGTNGTPRVGSETRPVSVGVNYIVKV
jgi:microcystin-dependent protein